MTLVVVISERRFMAEALQELLVDHDAVERCDVASDLDVLRTAISSTPPSALLVDLDEPGAPFAELAAALADVRRARRIGFFDTFTARHAEAAFDLHVTVLVSLASPIDHVCDAVLGERRALSTTAAEGLTRDQLARLGSLTPREIDVLQHLAHGRPTAATARLLGITVHTVDTHKRRAFQKLGVQSQAQAVGMAVSAGLVTSS